MSADIKAQLESYSNQTWEVWYEDTFDRDDPPRVDIRGRGLSNGLSELWARTLCESVTAQGREGFSRFWLKWDRGNIMVTGELVGAKRIRDWLFGDGGTCEKGYIASAKGALLSTLVAAHIMLIHSGNPQPSKSILHLAVDAINQTDFENRLRALVKK